MFHAFHGLYEEEQRNGNNFVVNVDIEMDTDGMITDLQQTVNYVEVFQIIQQRMLKKNHLLPIIFLKKCLN
jgi:dihydroneopterin aldolase